MYIYICYTIYIYLDYTVYNYVQLSIDYGFASSLYGLHYIYYLSIYNYFRSIHMSRDCILNATILKIYLEITSYDETRVLQQRLLQKRFKSSLRKIDRIRFCWSIYSIEKNLVIILSLSFIGNVNKPSPVWAINWILSWILMYCTNIHK